MNEWINVKDKLPPLDHPVLVFIIEEEFNDDPKQQYSYNQKVAWRAKVYLQSDNISWCYSLCCDCPVGEVHFWQELPANPETGIDPNLIIG